MGLGFLRRAAATGVSIVTVVGVTGHLPSATAAARATGPQATRAVDFLAAHRAHGATGSVQDGRVTLDRPVTNPVDAARQAGDLRKLENIAAGERLQLETAWNAHLPSLREAAAAAAAADGIVRIPFVAGDLDGDGLDDVVVAIIDTNLASVSLDARKGTDGSLLWSRDLANDFEAFATLTSAGDLLLTELVIDNDGQQGGCLALVCLIAGPVNFHWQVSLLKGATGAAHFSNGYPGEVDELFALADGLVAFAVADAARVTNAFAIPQVSDDTTGDGKPDVIVNHYDIVEVFAVAGAVGVALADVLLVASHAAVLSGADGTAAFAKDTDLGTSVIAFAPAGHTVGGDTADVLQTTLTQPLAVVLACAVICFEVDLPPGTGFSVNISMLDGQTGNAEWSQDAGDALIEATLTDVTGDGSDDLIAFTFDSQAIVNGGDGVTAWSRPTGFDSIMFLAGSLDGGANTDAIVATFVFSGPTLDIKLDRLEGSTGAPLLSTTQSLALPANGFTFFDLYPMGDADLDGGKEIVIDATNFDNTFTPTDSRTIVESGAAGTALADVASAGEVFSFPTGNLNGLAGVDLALIGVTFNPDFTVTFTLQGRALPGAATLWSRTDNASDAFLLSTGDTNGGGADDLMYSRITFDVNFDIASELDDLNGSDATTVWSLGAV